MDIYVFANQKGGVGKTTVALGIAAELAARRCRVLLVDLDAQASATKVLGVDVDRRCSMADVMLEPDRYALGEAIVASDWGFDLAPSETALASRESRRSTADEFVLKRQLAAHSRYDVVLVDCPPSLGVLTLNALTAASHLVVVTEPSFLALQGIEELLQMRDLVRAHYNPALVLSGVVVNRVERTVEHRIGLAEIARFFGSDLVWSPALPRRTVLQDAARHGRPLCEIRTRPAQLLSGELALSLIRSGRHMSRRPESRVALGGRKPARQHPAAPPAPALDVGSGRPNEEGGLVMFCVRVPASLRRRVKLAAVADGRTIQQLAVAALEEACRQYEV